MSERRRRAAFAAAACASAWMAAAAPAPPAWVEEYRERADRIVEAALATSAAWERLAALTDTFGPRLSGSPNLARAIEWALAEMERDGLERVRADPVMVPRWVRGEERLEIVRPVPDRLVMLGLGGSVATPPDGITAPVLVVRSFAELDARPERARGRIVLFNAPFTTYRETVQYRVDAASRAASHGAVAALVRSVGPMGLRTPHTGGMRYADGVPRIPAAAIAAEDANRLQRMQDRRTDVVLRLSMEAQFLPDAPSANVVAELRGRERPDELVVIGGHIDSWDVGTGASDDGGGVIATWEAVRLLKALDLRPRRTVRVVLWTNEENGLRGAYAYRDRYRDELRNHVLMLEVDSGVFRPSGFGFTGSGRARATVTAIASLLAGIGADTIGPAGGGADIAPSVQAANIPSMSLTVEGEYFLIHHTPADTIERIEPDDLARCVAAVAVMAYVVADLPERLDRGSGIRD